MSLQDDIKKLEEKINELREAYDKQDNNHHAQERIVQQLRLAQRHYKALTGKEY